MGAEKPLIAGFTLAMAALASPQAKAEGDSHAVNITNANIGQSSNNSVEFVICFGLDDSGTMQDYEFATQTSVHAYALRDPRVINALTSQNGVLGCAMLCNLVSGPPQRLG